MRAVAAAAMTMTMVAAPPFLLGTMGPGISADLDMSVPALAATVSFGYLVAAVASPTGGFVVQRIEPSRVLRLAGGFAGLGVVLVAAAQGRVTLAAAFVAFGAGNALIQPVVNGTLADAGQGRRQGMIFGLVQLAVPAATLLSRLLLASFNDVRSWRHAMLLLLVATLLPQFVVPRRGRVVSPRLPVPMRPVGSTRRRTLVAVVAAGFMGSGAATIVAVFSVASGLSHGLSPATAAAGLTLGSVCCIVVRVVSSGLCGTRSPRQLLGSIAVLQAGGVVGLVMVGTGTTVGYLVGVAVAFGCGWGWGWTGLLNI